MATPLELGGAMYGAMLGSEHGPGGAVFGAAAGYMLTRAENSALGVKPGSDE